MLTDDRDTAINRGLGDIDSACRQADGAAHRAVANGEGIARSDYIVVDGRIIQVEGLSDPVQVTLDARRIGVIVGRKDIACRVRAGK